MRDYFENIPVGAVYRLGGSLWRKRSSRTTQLLNYGQGLVTRDAWYYEKKRSVVQMLLPTV